MKLKGVDRHLKWKEFAFSLDPDHTLVQELENKLYRELKLNLEPDLYDLIYFPLKVRWDIIASEIRKR